MRRSFLVAPLLATLVLSACAKSSGTEAAAAPQPKGPTMPAGVTPAMITLGDSLYNAGSCQRCHGQKGVGANNGPALVTGPWLHSKGTFEEIVTTITNGVPRASIKDAARRFPMNGRGGNMNLNDDQIKAVAAYVWSISRDKK
ncbi:MAG: c-type cytochrome [Gemmatimonadaceae bacterium]|nr:c-type cytochrome [Gemmatimonadaceae bacterium]